MDSDKKQESRDQPDDQQAQGQDSGADQNPGNTWNRLDFTQVVPPTATQTQQGEPSTSGGQATVTDASTGAISKRRAPPKSEPAPDQPPVTEPSTVPQTKTDQPAVDTQQQTPPQTRTPSPPPLPDTSPPHSPDKPDQQTKTEDPSKAVSYQHRLELPYGTSLKSESLLSAAWQTYRKRHGLPAEPGDRPFRTRCEANERRRKLGFFSKPEVKKPVSSFPKVQSAQPTVSIPDDQVSQRSADQGKTSPQPSDSDDDFEKISPPTSRTPSVSDLSATVPSGNVRSQLNRLKKAVSSFARRTTPKGLRKFISRATGRSPSASAGAAPADKSTEGRASGEESEPPPVPYVWIQPGEEGPKPGELWIPSCFDTPQMKEYLARRYELMVARENRERAEREAGLISPPPYPEPRPARTRGFFKMSLGEDERLRQHPEWIGRDKWFTDFAGFQLPWRWNQRPPPYADWNKDEVRQEQEWVRQYYDRQRAGAPPNYYDLFPEYRHLRPDVDEEELEFLYPIGEFLRRRALQAPLNQLAEVKRGEPPSYDELYPGGQTGQLPSFDQLFAEAEMLRRLNLRLDELRFADQPDQGTQSGQPPSDEDPDGTGDDEDPDQGASGGQ